jgi:hypothetical protein
MKKGWIAAVAAACLVFAPVSGAYADDDPPPEEEYEPNPWGDENNNGIVCVGPDGQRVDDVMSSPFDPPPYPPACPDGYTATPISTLPPIY